MVGEEQRPGVPRGFLWGGVRAGLKASGGLDLAAALLPAGGRAAVCFTTNQAIAAPIVVGRRHLTSTGGRISAVLINAGNANCATGAEGEEACIGTCVAAAQHFGCLFDEVLPSSTGIIGVPFPAAAVVEALPALRRALGDSAAHVDAFALAILTTDTRAKIARAVVDRDGDTVHLLGIAKGAGMIGPQLGPAIPAGPQVAPHATMLVYLFTDLQAETEELRALLSPAVDSSFNRISIDGDTSTNDTVALIASGGSRIALDERTGPAFANALDLVCRSLARQIVADGEGVQHVITLEITGAASDEDALRLARTVANSPLCKTAWSSADPNWGRILAAAGRSGVSFEPAGLAIRIGGITVFENGVRAATYHDAEVHEVMSAREYTIALTLTQGNGTCSFITGDLTAEYVRINADYST